MSSRAGSIRHLLEDVQYLERRRACTGIGGHHSHDCIPDLGGDPGCTSRLAKPGWPLKADRAVCVLEYPYDRLNTRTKGRLSSDQFICNRTERPDIGRETSRPPIL